MSLNEPSVLELRVRSTQSPPIQTYAGRLLARGATQQLLCFVQLCSIQAAVRLCLQCLLKVLYRFIRLLHLQIQQRNFLAPHVDRSAAQILSRTNPECDRPRKRQMNNSFSQPKRFSATLNSRFERLLGLINVLVDFHNASLSCQTGRLMP